MNYSDTLDFLYSSLPMYQRIGKAAYKSDLETTVILDEHLGNPHRSFKTIHIAGTNGKGSVSHMLAAVLQSAGYKTGLYTSPHYIDFRERIRVNGNMVDEQYVIDFIEGNKDILLDIKASFFEMTVAMAFKYFEDEDVDVAVIETGMGGRLDSTNIITPLVSVITNIGLDHTKYLGETVEEIAGEKAGIIKPGIPVVIGHARTEVREIFEGKTREMRSEMYFAEENYMAKSASHDNGENMQGFDISRHGEIFMKELLTDLLGDYQAFNIITVLQLIELLKSQLEISKVAVREGLMNVRGLTGFKGRWQIIRQSPMVICDSGHNADGLRMSIPQLIRMKGKILHIILGLVNDKDIGSILSLLPVFAVYYFTRADIPRALNQDILMAEAAKYSLKGNSYPSVIEAYKSAMDNADEKDTIFVGGSSFVVADFLKGYDIA